ncbi:MAG: bifunctional demethylmenaquinone methyltransferase/2-methoxy-6-polyprenyl-1,4-benzoquinol methylase UbiE [Alphaproteobacteria bacterium]|nr:bifunctional demethylmenaquinone methyltransferase/2-methoxy-6-polyprenyl-1,4-benzoquinol methylase UbiE [Alphaproteobacteria bacterium]
MTLNPESRWFGNQPVEEDEKTRLVHGVFTNVAAKYDLMNDVMSGGLHRLWKRRFIKTVRPKAGQQCLDVAGGTGDIAFGLFEESCRKAHVTVCDLTPSMVEVGRDRAINKGIIKGIDWTVGNAEDLPFEDNSFDHYTIAFGLRNVTRIDNALHEAYRVLKPGGRFYCLEFSQPVVPMLEKIYDAYSFHIIPKMGQLIAQDKESYQYLVESIRQFPNQEKLKMRLQSAGFSKPAYTDFTFGIVALHQGLKA